MNRLLASALAASVTIALPATAFAETLDYDFTMSVTTLSDGYGVFEGLNVGDSIDFHVVLDSAGNNAQITVSGVEVTSIVSGSSWTWASSWDEGTTTTGWDAGNGVWAESLQVNGTLIKEGVFFQQQLNLNYSETADGELSINTGWLTVSVANGSSAYLKAQYVDSPTSVPELDPKSGTGAIALLVGGMALAFSRRRRQQCDGVAG